MTSRQDVAEYLQAFKVAMEYGSFALAHREKNMQSLADLGLTINQAKELLAELAVEDYVDGPEPDDMDEDRKVWVFGKSLNDIELYLKLRLNPDPKRRNMQHAKVISFHAADQKLRYPLRGAQS